MFLGKISASLMGCALLLAPVSSLAADRGPSMPEERKQALEYIQHIEADPLNPSLKPEIQWVTMWAIQVPDIHVSACMLVNLPKGDKKHSQTLFTGMMLAQTAFAIQHLNQPADLHQEYQAGVEGLLRAYEKVLAANPKDRQPEIDDLIKRREAGTLAEFVEERAASSCKN